MKTATRPDVIATQAIRGGSLSARLRDYWLLSKPRVTTLVWLTTAAGLFLGARHTDTPLGGWLIFFALVGSWLVIASANALNQVLEWQYDARMKRTMNRPIPSGRLRVEEAQWIGVLWGALGVLSLMFFVNPLTALLGALSIAFYVFAYTPLKRRTPVCTAIGAIPGAIPPLAGWTAAYGQIAPEALLLFAIQYFWQFPHFWAIAWLNRDDYAAAGFKMLPFLNASGSATARYVLGYSVALFLFSLSIAPFTQQIALYLVGAVGLGMWMISKAIRFRQQPNTEGARAVLMASVLYLPALLGLLMIAM
ncbi:MAG: heme o synthase [Fimbriimonadia bacterium]|nr:heme o synthase [Fimbriimonadia bacterium]